MSTWNAGQGNSVTISGSGFGTNTPTLNFSVGGISYSISSSNDTQIAAIITPAANSPAESLTVSVTNNGYGGSGFISNGGNSSTGSGATVSVNPIPAPAPRILFNGNDVTGTTQSVVVGQQIQLSGCPGSGSNCPSGAQLPQGLSMGHLGWSVGGIIVGGWTPGQQPSSADLTGTSATFYWIGANSGTQTFQVQYQYCMSNGQCDQLRRRRSTSVRQPT